MKVLACNAGSTSLKFRLYQMPEECGLAVGKIEKIGSPCAIISIETACGRHQFEQPVADFLESARLAISLLIEHGALQSEQELDTVAFKTVHGGEIVKPCIIDQHVLDALEDYITVAPLHNRVYADLIRAFQKAMPKTPMIAVFETSFHCQAPEQAQYYAVPYEWKDRYGIRRYGFHGASHSYINTRVQQLLGVRDLSSFHAISCHLGGSSSLCALRGGISLGATQGFSPQSGIAMGTRTGDLDVYVLFHMLKKGFTPQELDHALFHESGLKGLSGISDDVRDLEKAANAGNHRAKLALDVFCYDVKRYIGQYLALLGRTDVIVFTGGIGENGIEIRRRVLSDMEHLGIRLDETRNRENQPESKISADDSPIAVYVIPTNEEIMIARQAYQVLEGVK